jgi:small subunit ribosomal protein S20
VANIKSQIKRNRQNNKKRLRNRVYRGEARIAVRNARTTIEEGVPESKAALQEAISLLDKAAEQGVIHKNNAARRKSRLMKAFARLEPVKVEAAPAAVEPVVEVEPVKKKAAPRRAFARKVAEPKAEAAAEPKAEPKKKTATKKPAAKKTETTSSPKGKKPAVKKTESKKPETTPKKTTTTRKKPTAKK